MSDDTKVTPMQLMQLARQLKKSRSTAMEAEQIGQLAQTGLSNEQQAQLHNVMQDKQALQRILSSPEAQELMKKLGGKPE